MSVPTFVTHYYLPDRSPFLNLSDLERGAQARVMTDLMHQRAEAQQHRVFGNTYIAMRSLVEARLHELFLRWGGHPERTAPHYFVLGESAWFKGLAVGMKEIQLSLADLPVDRTSVTYPDSFTAMEVTSQFGLPHEPRPYHGQVFGIDDLGSLIDRFGFPAVAAESNYAGYERRTMEKYVEVQLWTDEPVRRFLSPPP